jgi:hypothetical protein
VQRHPSRAIGAFALALTLVLSLGSTSAMAQDDGTTTTQPIRDSDTGLNDIVPQPNSGEAPDDPSDRGGWQQFMVFGLIVGGMGVIVVLVVRQSRHARRART